MKDDARGAEREAMVREQVEARGVRDPRVLGALRSVPRHLFAPAGSDADRAAYEDRAHPIGEGQTISQPFIVARMTELLRLRGDEKVLEVGAGSGYQTAVLSLLAREVVAVERLPVIAGRARAVLDAFGARNVRLFVGDGSAGWLDEAPYDAALIAAAAPEVPAALVRQIHPGGRVVLPVGPEDGVQRLLLVTVNGDGSGRTHVEDYGEVSFVPLIGTRGYGLPADLGEPDL